ncbi:conserved Plasmodium protein, unknown function [Plasmodium ovale]|uniref:Uncharacterized protein n=1 Tax=Plasmodium ovale TaxID=36330 RepID=A0A1D3KXB4_PLAOA|nr:conserved Plasmodium protein, unknown function [Plasmodium ovale]
MKELVGRSRNERKLDGIYNKQRDILLHKYKQKREKINRDLFLNLSKRKANEVIPFPEIYEKRRKEVNTNLGLKSSIRRNVDDKENKNIQVFRESKVAIQRGNNESGSVTIYKGLYLIMYKHIFSKNKFPKSVYIFINICINYMNNNNKNLFIFCFNELIKVFHEKYLYDNDTKRRHYVYTFYNDNELNIKCMLSFCDKVLNKIIDSKFVIKYKYEENDNDTTGKIKNDNGDTYNNKIKEDWNMPQKNNKSNDTPSKNNPNEHSKTTIIQNGKEENDCTKNNIKHIPLDNKNIVKETPNNVNIIIITRKEKNFLKALKIKIYYLVILFKLNDNFVFNKLMGIYRQIFEEIKNEYKIYEEKVIQDRELRHHLVTEVVQGKHTNGDNYGEADHQEADKEEDEKEEDDEEEDDEEEDGKEKDDQKEDDKEEDDEEEDGKEKDDQKEDDKEEDDEEEDGKEKDDQKEDDKEEDDEEEDGKEKDDQKEDDKEEDDEEEDGKEKDDQKEDDKEEDDEEEDGKEEDGKEEDGKEQDDKEEDDEEEDDEEEDGKEKDDQKEDGKEKDDQKEDGKEKDDQKEDGKEKDDQKEDGKEKDDQKEDDKEAASIAAAAADDAEEHFLRIGESWEIPSDYEVFQIKRSAFVKCLSYLINFINVKWAKTLVESLLQEVYLKKSIFDVCDEILIENLQSTVKANVHKRKNKFESSHVLSIGESLNPVVDARDEKIVSLHGSHVWSSKQMER